MRSVYSRMKALMGSPKVALATVFLLSAAAGVCAYYARPSDAEDDLIVDNSERFFASASQGAELESMFKLTNRSSAELSLDQVIAACDCTDPVLSTRRLAPNESATLKITWRIGAGRGDVHTPVTVLYGRVGMPVRNRLDLVLRASVVPDLQYHPSTITFRDDGVTRLAVSFTPGRIGVVRLVNAYCDQKAFTASLNGDTVEVAFNKQHFSPHHSKVFLFVETESVSEKYCRIPIVVLEKDDP